MTESISLGYLLVYKRPFTHRSDLIWVNDSINTIQLSKQHA